MERCAHHWNFINSVGFQGKAHEFIGTSADGKLDCFQVVFERDFRVLHSLVFSRMAPPSMAGLRCLAISMLRALGLKGLSRENYRQALKRVEESYRLSDRAIELLSFVYVGGMDPGLTRQDVLRVFQDP